MILRDVPGAAAYARAYLCFGFVAVLLFAFVTPPYQVPDEPAHFRRADQISRGELLAYRLDVNASGGVASTGIAATLKPFETLAFNAHVKATAAMFAQAEPVTWTNTPAVPTAFSNTALYPPLLYLPGAAATLGGRLASLNIIDTLRLVRVVNGLFSVAVVTFAIAIAGAAAPWIFVVLSMPMSLSLMASASHDGPMFAMAALAAAILINASPGARFAVSPRAFWVMCGAIALVASARPIYAPLAILPLLVTGQRWAVRLAGVLFIVALTGIWSRIVAPLTLVQFHPEVNAEAQMAFLRSDPLNFLVVFARTIKLGFWNIVEMFVGRLGWLDTPLPALYHDFARIELFLALAVVAGFSVRRLDLRAFVVMAAIFGGFFVTCLSLYIIWTKPGELYVVGVQGRYLIPLAVFVPAALPFGLAAASQNVARAAFVALWIFPPISIAVAIFALVRRYYI